MIAFFSGLFIGSVAAILTMSLCFAARKGDDDDDDEA